MASGQIAIKKKDQALINHTNRFNMSRIWEEGIESDLSSMGIME